MDVLAGKCGYRYSDHVEDILSVRGADNVIAAAQTRDGKLVVPAPLDYVAGSHRGIAHQLPNMAGAPHWEATPAPSTEEKNP